MPRYKPTTFDYFIERLKEAELDDFNLPWNTYPCLEWDRGKTTAGYGQVRHNGRTQYVHRLSLNIVRGTMSDDIQACHRCDNPPCFRPSHLFAATNHQNVMDMISKGRAKYGSLPGERCRLAKLTEIQVIEIRKMSAAGMSGYAIAKIFGVNKASIYSIIHRKTWTHI